MPIKTEVEEVEKNIVLLKVEVPFDEMGEAIERAYRDIAAKAKIPGFRQGKAPRTVIDQHVGKETVLNEALQEVIQIVYPQAVESAGIKPVAMPEINVVNIAENQPLVFNAKVQVKPAIKLGSLDEVEIEALPKKSVAEGVKVEVEKMQDKFATLDHVKGRATKNGDYVLIDYTGYLAGKPFEGGQASDYMLELGSGTFISGFEEQLIGEKVASEKEVKVTFPEGYQAEHLAGKEVSFTVKIKETKVKKRPKADDEFAKNVSKFETLKEWKADLKKAVAKRQKEEEQTILQKRAVSKLVELSEVDVPSGMVERKIDQMVGNFERQIKQVQKMDLEQWSEAQGVSIDVLRKSYKEDAEKSLKEELVLEALAGSEKLKATEKDVENEIKKLAGIWKKEVDEVKEELNKNESWDLLKYRLSINKAVDLLVDKVKIKKRG